MKPLVLLLFLLTFCNGQTPTPAPTPNVTVPGVATLRPTTPTMPPIMMPDPDRETAENKTTELPIVAVYFIMLGITGLLTCIGISLHIYGTIFPSSKERTIRERNRKVSLDEEW